MPELSLNVWGQRMEPERVFRIKRKKDCMRRKRSKETGRANDQDCNPWNFSQYGFGLVIGPLLFGITFTLTYYVPKLRKAFNEMESLK